MKEDQELLETEASTMRRHQSMQRLSRGELIDSHMDEELGALVVPDQQGNLRITVKKTKPILGIAIEGGANTKHPLPRIINIHENGAAFEAGGLEVGQLILEVDGQKVEASRCGTSDSRVVRKTRTPRHRISRGGSQEVQLGTKADGTHLLRGLAVALPALSMRGKEAVFLVRKVINYKLYDLYINYYTAIAEAYYVQSFKGKEKSFYKNMTTNQLITYYFNDFCSVANCEINFILWDILKVTENKVIENLTGIFKNLLKSSIIEVWGYLFLKEGNRPEVSNFVISSTECQRILHLGNLTNECIKRKKLKTVVVSALVQFFARISETIHLYDLKKLIFGPTNLIAMYCYLKMNQRKKIDNLGRPYLQEYSDFVMLKLEVEFVLTVLDLYVNKVKKNLANPKITYLSLPYKIKIKKFYSCTYTNVDFNLHS
ncbi:hypothetical protein C0J52_16529 [Blattella germanica]|nr:hypothetical protein C0J52_16529 [Blattella germanica]